MSLVADPNILTKDRLKEELQKHNVTLPRSDSKKSVYVDLYKRELLDNRERLEFSDDEIEFTSKRKKKLATPTKKPIKMATKVTPSRTSIRGGGTVNVTTLSDAELSSKLQEMGINVGPIMESTRKIYQKKLEKLLAEAPREPAPVYVSPAVADTLPLHDEFSDNTQDEEEEEEPEPPVSKPVTRKSPARSERFEFKRSPLKPRATRSLYAEQKDEVDYSPMTSWNSSNNANVVTRRYTTQETNSVTEVKKPFSANNVVTQAAPPAKENKKPQAAKKSRIPVWVQVAIFIIIAVVIFLIIQNMEPANANPFKHLTGN